MNWFYAEGGRQQGPVEETALDDLVQRGVVRDDTLVWREGLAAWQPHSVARPRPVAPPPPAAPIFVPTPAPAPAPPPPAAETRYCAECGRGFPANELSAVGAVAVCGTCRPAVMQRMAPSAPAAAPSYPQASYPQASYPQAPQQQAYQQPYQQPYPGQQQGQPQYQQPMMGGRHYAGFWIRFVARFIDAILVGIVSFILFLPLTFLGIGSLSLANRQDPAAALAALPAMMGVIGITTVLRIALFAAYEIYFVSTRGATPGKMALGLKIIRADGGPVPMGLAAGRYFAQFLSSFILCIGYIMAGFDPEKRALHDRLCETRVIYAK
jgi:uncharacterized RDD family membrane protein YckC